MFSIPYTTEMKYMYTRIMKSKVENGGQNNWLSKRYLVGAKSWIRDQNTFNAYIKKKSLGLIIFHYKDLSHYNILIL